VPRAPTPPRIGEGLVVRRLLVRSEDAIFAKALLEAHEGLSAVFGEAGGDLTIAAPSDREAELDEVLASIADALRAREPRRARA
jgi:hypothetical protein